MPVAGKYMVTNIHIPVKDIPEADMPGITHIICMYKCMWVSSWKGIYIFIHRILTTLKVNIVKMYNVGNFINILWTLYKTNKCRKGLGHCNA